MTSERLAEIKANEDWWCDKCGKIWRAPASTNGRHDACGYSGLKLPRNRVADECVAAIEQRDREIGELKSDMLHIHEYWNRNDNLAAMSDALGEIIATAKKWVQA